jgi:hypothetical protein
MADVKKEQAFEASKLSASPWNAFYSGTKAPGHRMPSGVRDSCLGSCVGRGDFIKQIRLQQEGAWLLRRRWWCECLFLMTCNNTVFWNPGFYATATVRLLPRWEGKGYFVILKGTQQYLRETLPGLRQCT